MYVDEGEFVFESSTNTEIGITLLSNHFAQFSLKMHIRIETNTLKTEWVFFLPPDFFNKQTWPLNYCTNFTMDPSEERNQEKEMHTWGQRIHQVQRNIDHQNKRRICHFHQSFQIFGELHFILSLRRLKHWHTYCSRKCINGIPLQILDRR